MIAYIPNDSDLQVTANTESLGHHKHYPANVLNLLLRVSFLPSHFLTFTVGDMLINNLLVLLGGIFRSL